MKAFGRRAGLGAAVLLLAGAAAAQENLDSGKTPAQLYASDCAICHKSPRGLSRGGGAFGLQGFLREHYTASREVAAAIAAYVEAVDRGAAPAERAVKRSAKPKEKGAAAEGKPSGKPPDAKPSETKTGETPAAAKPAGDKPVEAKADGAKPVAKPDAAKKPDSEKKPD